MNELRKNHRLGYQTITEIIEKGKPVKDSEKLDDMMNQAKINRQ